MPTLAQMKAEILQKEQEPEKKSVRIWHGGNKGLKEIKGDVGPGNIFGGLFGSQDQEHAKSHGDGSMYYMDVPEDKVLTQRALNYDIDHKEQIAALKKSMPWLDDEDIDLAHQAVIDDASHKLDQDDLQRIFREDDPGLASWEAQRIRGKVAKHLGFHAVEMDDEHGTSYLVLPGVDVKSEKTEEDMPSLAQMKLALAKKPNALNLQNTGANEAIGMGNKAYVSPDGEGVPIPIGGVDLNPQQPGQQLFQPLPPPNFQQQGQQQGQQQLPQGQLGMPQAPQDQGTQQDQPPPVGGMLSMTPQGQAMDAMSNGPQDQQPQPTAQPQQLAKGGKVKSKRPVVVHKNMDTIKLELSKKKAKK